MHPSPPPRAHWGVWQGERSGHVEAALSLTLIPLAKGPHARPGALMEIRDRPAVLLLPEELQDGIIRGQSQHLRTLLDAAGPRMGQLDLISGVGSVPLERLHIHVISHGNSAPFVVARVHSLRCRPDRATI